MVGQRDLRILIITRHQKFVTLNSNVLLRVELLKDGMVYLCLS